MKKAIIYLRVSTTKQVDGASLDTQQMMCQQWAVRNNVVVDRVFREDGASAKSRNRPVMNEMMRYIEDNNGRHDYLITYQTDRLTRDIADFFALKTELKSYGIEYKNINSSLEESLNDELVQGFEALIAQHDNRLKSKRVRENMQRHAMAGYRMSKAPYGLRNVRDALGSPVVEPVVGVADKIAVILREYSSGTHTISSLLRLCENIDLKDAHGKPIRFQSMSKMLRQPLYAGLERSAHTDGVLVKSKFEGLITPTVFERNQELLRKNKNTSARYKKNNPTFPLRSFIQCSICDKPLTGSSPRNGSGVASPRYHCVHCHTKSVRVEEAHMDFTSLLAQLAPDAATQKYLKEMIIRVWRDEAAILISSEKELHDTIEKANAQKNKAVERLIAGDISTEEKNALVTGLDEQVAKAKKKLDEIGDMSKLKTDGIDYSLRFMGDAPHIWNNSSIEHQIIYQKLVFPEGITYDLEKREFGTAKTSVLYRLAEIKKDPSKSEESLVVIPWRIELQLPG